MAQLMAPVNAGQRRGWVSRRAFIRGVGGLLAGALFLADRAGAEASGAAEAGALPAAAPASAAASGAAEAGAPPAAVAASGDAAGAAGAGTGAAAFRGLIGERFLVHGPLDVQEVKLTEVRSRPWRAAKSLQAGKALPRGEAFSLMFRGAPDRALLQGTYRFAHAGMGAFDLLIVPMATAADGQLYEAAFNLLMG